MTGLDFFGTGELIQTMAENQGLEGLGFGIFHVRQGAKTFKLLREKCINQRDISVLFIMMSICDSRTGKIKFMVKALADELGITASSLSSSLSRLKKAKLIAPFQEENGGKYYLIDPGIFSVGSKKKQGFYLKKFDSVFESES
jgi:DNA-binding transcriptional ArsR family regulator